LDKLSGEMLNEYAGHVNRVYQLENCMNNACSQIFSGSEDGHVYMWDLVDAKVKQKLKHLNEKTVHSLSYHPEEDKLLSAQEQFVYLWQANAEN
jgi:mitogen-activated protein kinase organizer 1